MFQAGIESGEASVEQGTDSSLVMQVGLEDAKFSVPSVLPGQRCGGRSRHFLFCVHVFPGSVQSKGRTL